jgi:hypothetical protein
MINKGRTKQKFGRYFNKKKRMRRSWDLFSYMAKEITQDLKYFKNYNVNSVPGKLHLEICEKHGMLSDPESFSNELERTAETILTTMKYISDCDFGKFGDYPSIPDSVKDTTFDSLRLMANLCMFLDAVKPIVDKYCPSDEDKARFVDYIKKMEEEKDE